MRLLIRLGYVQGLYSFNRVLGNLMNFCGSFNLASGGLLEELLCFLWSGMKNDDTFCLLGGIALQKSSKILLFISSEDPAPKLHYFFLVLFPCLHIHSLSWLATVQICPSELREIHGGWKLFSTKRNKGGNTERLPCLGVPQGPVQFHLQDN